MKYHFSSQHIDVLQELINIGLGQAAHALNVLTGKKVEISVPQVELFSDQEAIDRMMASKPTTLSAVYQSLGGNLSGECWMILSEQDALRLVNLVVGDHYPHDDDNLESDDAFKEIGNVVLGAAIGGIMNSLEIMASAQMPEVRRGNARELLKSSMVGKMQNIQAVLIKTYFELYGEQVEGYILVVLDLEGRRNLYTQVSKLVLDYFTD